jgi:hypothetical protein
MTTGVGPFPYGSTERREKKKTPIFRKVYWNIKENCKCLEKAYLHNACIY